MAKTLKQLENGIRIKYLVRPKKYYLFFGNEHISVHKEFNNGFLTIEDAEEFGKNLIQDGPFKNMFKK